MKYILLLITSLFAFHANAQNTLTKADAVATVLEKNFGIQIAKNNIAIAENNTSKANTGYRPTVNASAGTQANLGGAYQKFATGQEVNVTNAFNWGVNASVGANYSLYDPSRALNLAQLKETLNLTELELRQAIEGNVLQLLNGYYEVARLTENLGVLAQTLDISRDRLRRVQTNYDYGQGSRLDLLNAEVDIQRDSINFLQIKQQIANAQRNLNVIMGSPVNTEFVVDTTVVYADNLDLNTLIQSAQSGNVQVLIANQNLAIRGYDLELIAATKKPTVGAQASYDFNFQDNAAGSFSDLSNSRGLGVGVNMQWNIYDGGLRNVRTQNTQLALASQQLNKNQLLQELERDMTNAWENYQTALYILSAEANNLATNQVNFERTEEYFKAGRITSLEFRQAQLNRLNAATNYNMAKYNAKVLEWSLLSLSGGMLEAF